MGEEERRGEKRREVRTENEIILFWIAKKERGCADAVCSHFYNFDTFGRL